MIVSVMFKDKNKNFRGRTYDYILCEGEKPPPKNSIIRMLDEDYNWKCYGTRVKVVNIKSASSSATESIHYIETTLED